MNKARIARIARLVALRQQQRRLREAAHAEALRHLQSASDRKDRCHDACDGLDREHDQFLLDEINPLDLELLGLARNAARGQLRQAEHQVVEANTEADLQREQLLGAHQAHRSLELYHERIQALLRRDLARSEQRDLDELAQRSAGLRRPW